MKIKIRSLSMSLARPDVHEVAPALREERGAIRFRPADSDGRRQRATATHRRSILSSAPTLAQLFVMATLWLCGERNESCMPEAVEVDPIVEALDDNEGTFSFTGEVNLLAADEHARSQRECKRSGRLQIRMLTTARVDRLPSGITSNDVWRAQRPGDDIDVGASGFESIKEAA